MTVDPHTSEDYWRTLRSNYPGALNGIFLNSGSRGLLSKAAFAAGIESLTTDRDMSAPKLSTDYLLADLRLRFATLINSASSEIAVTKNVSEGLNAIATCIDWRPGDNVVLCSEVEHPNNIYPWLKLADRGVEVRDVPAVEGGVDAQAILGAIDARTRVVTVSAVSYSPGFRSPLARIGQATQDAGALFLVDAVQACGPLIVDVQRDCIDALATSASKGLLGARGLGLLYVRRALAERLRPTNVANNSVDRGGRHYSEFVGKQIKLWGDARRFEVGHPNYTGVSIARVALGELLDIGSARIEARVVALASALADGLSALGWPVSKLPKGVVRSHIVTVGRRTDGGPDSTGDARLDAFAAQLASAGVQIAIRRGQLRFGFHFYNSTDDVRTVLDIAARLA
jgi:cysteine desulfurase / selenocysteine lyase